MIFENILENKKIILFLLIIGLVNAFFIGLIYQGHFYRGDTPSYVEAVQWLNGERLSTTSEHRILKPLSLVVPLFFEKIGLKAEYGLQFQSIIFYFLSIVLVFDLVFSLYNNKKQDILGVVLFLTAWPFLTNALAYLTDIAGWFFFLLTVWLLIRLHVLEKISPLIFLWLGIIGGIGFLFKESAIASLFFYFGYLVFVYKKSIKERVVLFSFCLSGFFIPVLISSFIVFIKTSYTFFDWYKANWQQTLYYNFAEVILNGILTFMLGWLFIFFGIWREWKEKNKQRIKWLLALLLPSICWIFWSFPAARMMYIGFPLLVLLGSRGLIFSRKKPVLVFSLLFLYILLNFFLPSFLSYNELRMLF